MREFIKKILVEEYNEKYNEIYEKSDIIRYLDVNFNNISTNKLKNKIA